MHTHATKDCRKWHPDGTSKYSRKSKNANRHARDSSDMKACFAHMRKENKSFSKSDPPIKSIRSPRRSSTILPLTLAMTVTLTRMMGPAKALENMKKILI